MYANLRSSGQVCRRRGDGCNQARSPRVVAKRSVAIGRVGVLRGGEQLSGVGNKSVSQLGRRVERAQVSDFLAVLVQFEHARQEDVHVHEDRHVHDRRQKDEGQVPNPCAAHDALALALLADVAHREQRRDRRYEVRQPKLKAKCPRVVELVPLAARDPFRHRTPLSRRAERGESERDYNAERLKSERGFRPIDGDESKQSGTLAATDAAKKPAASPSGSGVDSTATSVSGPNNDAAAASTRVDPSRSLKRTLCKPYSSVSQ